MECVRAMFSNEAGLGSGNDMPPINENLFEKVWLGVGIVY